MRTRSSVAVPVLGSIALAAGLLATGAVVRCGVPALPDVATGVGQRQVEIRVKLRSHDTAHALAGTAAVFAHLPCGVAADDARRRWRKLQVPELTAAAILAELQLDPGVEAAYLTPKYSLARSLDADVAMPPDVITGGAIREKPSREDESCPITTPSFEAYQGYLGPAPAGIDAPAAWRRGHRGQGVWFADIEGGWNGKHEDLPGDRIAMAPGGRPVPDRSWEAHGTAVLGEVVGRDNGKGVVGIAPDVEKVFTSSLLREDGSIDVADAIDAAASQLRPGDVLLIELQSAGPRSRYIPVEYWGDVFDAIKAATDRGVVVIEAAGNGYENLDHAIYERAFDRSVRDSGAIMIGAGAPSRPGYDDREKLDFSNYGTRVDVQGWGRKVATLDYGDLQACDDEATQYKDRHYTDEFSGTSSASPIVAGAAVLLQGIAKQMHAEPLSPAVLRRILHETGTPQTGDTSRPIGPRPDLARAIEAVSKL